MKKILLIEDNFEMRENTAEILELAGYDVITAENGKIGVASAKQYLPDLILCDVMMPELDGYGVLYMLGKNVDTASIPFIFLTAKAERSDFRKGMNLGADDYLTKPFEEMDLLEAVETRFMRNDVIKQQYEQNIDGLDRFFSSITEGQDELIKLSKERKHRIFKKKEVLFHEGDYPNILFFIEKGRVKVSKMNEDGKEYVTNLYGEGDFVGYMSLLEDVDYTETAIAMDNTEVYMLPKEDFTELIYRNKEVASQFMKMLSRNLIEKEQQLLDLAYNTVRKRVADALLRLRDKYIETGENTFSISISRDDLASIVGTATESVIRTLSSFKEDSMIEIKGSKIKIINEEGLRNLRY
ncbi:MAG: response regulator [Cytophagales bacterium]|nr:response regulator [Cytophagales bacterium]